MNVLFVHEVSWMSKVVFDVHLLAEAMSLLGHEVYALYYESMWDREKMPKEMVMSRALPNARVHLICPSFVKITGLSRLSAFVTHYLEIGKAIRDKKISAIVLYSVPTNGLQAVHWARKFNIPVVFRSIDVLNQLVPYRAFRSATRMLERAVYSKVDRVLALTWNLCDYVVGLGADEDKVGVLPMTVDTDSFCPSGDVGGLRRMWGLAENDKVILFMGTLFGFSGLEGFIRKIAWRMQRSADVKLLIVGDGEQRQLLGQLAKDWGLEKCIIITGFQPYRDMPQYINLADVCINTFLNNDITKDIFPGKIAQYLACGKPVVMRPLDGVKSMIAGQEQGVVYADTDYGMATAVGRLLDSSDARDKIGKSGLEYARQHHDSMRVAKQLESELVFLVKAKSGG